ncbi:MAG: HAD-IA family hydrolase [Clostridiaceae bacterium]|nr:HAD-IA family hydrolase [Clostridiaceae bacterium]
MPIKAVLFDFDGTLLNTNDLILESYKHAFKTVLDRDIPYDEFLSLYGRPLFKSLSAYEKHEKLYYAYKDFNENGHDYLIKTFPGAKEGLLRLKELNLKLAIVTSKRTHVLEKQIKMLGCGDIFDLIITPDDTQNHKPHPEPALLACERLGVLPHETYFVGDSVFDMECGKNAGCNLCAVSYTLTPIEKLMEYGPKYVVGSILEFAGLVEKEVG